MKSTTPAVTPVITNTGTAILNISSATISNPEFFFSPASVVLPTSVAPGASTSPFVIVFTPSGPGKQTGELVLQDDAAGSPHTIQLIGFGLDVAPGDFALAAPDNNTNLLSQSLPAGVTAEYSFSITGSPNNISLTCSGAPQGAFCSLPSSVTLNSASVLGSDSTVPIVVKVATSGPTAGLQTMRTSLWWTLAIAVGLAFAAGRRRGARTFVFAFCTAAMTTS
ncbi:MAG TPA: hypothetical protein VFL42_08460, partial [Terriglobales bacterium]|nr:hypothetical protein [Terriglobales bacterium]